MRLLNRLYIEPPQGLGYPMEDLPMLRKMEKYILAGRHGSVWNSISISMAFRIIRE
jgi:hypothetical protein